MWNVHIKALWYTYKGYFVVEKLISNVGTYAKLSITCYSKHSKTVMKQKCLPG